MPSITRKTDRHRPFMFVGVAVHAATPLLHGAFDQMQAQTRSAEIRGLVLKRQIRGQHTDRISVEGDAEEVFTGPAVFGYVIG